MTLINRLRKKAKSNPDYLDIKPSHVRQLAAQMHSLRHRLSGVVVGPTVEDVEEIIKRGDMRVCGIHVRVVFT
jgi:hypothetical protein